VKIPSVGSRPARTGDAGAGASLVRAAKCDGDLSEQMLSGRGPGQPGLPWLSWPTLPARRRHV